LTPNDEVSFNLKQGGDTPDTQALAEQLVRVEQNVGYRFANPALLRVALRHSSLGVRAH